MLGAQGWVALVLPAVWRLPEVARTVACSIVVDDRQGDIERTGAADTLMIVADHRSVPALRQAYSTSKWPGPRVRVLGALKRSGDPQIDRRLAAIAEHETNQAVRQWALDQPVRRHWDPPPTLHARPAGHQQRVIPLWKSTTLARRC